MTEKDEIYAALDTALNGWQEEQAHRAGGFAAVLALRQQKADEAARAELEASQTEIGKLARARLAKLDQARKEGGEAGYLAMLRQLDEEDRQAAQAKRDAEKQAADQALKDADEAALKAEALQVWLHNGGDEAAFEKEWPSLRVEAVRQKTLADVAKPSRTYIFDVDF